MNPKDTVEQRDSDLGDFAPPEAEIVRPEDATSEVNDSDDDDEEEEADEDDDTFDDDEDGEEEDDDLN